MRKNINLQNNITQSMKRIEELLQGPKSFDEHNRYIGMIGCLNHFRSLLEAYPEENWDESLRAYYKRNKDAAKKRTLSPRGRERARGASQAAYSLWLKY